MKRYSEMEVKFTITYYPNRTGEPEIEQLLLLAKNDSLNFGDIDDEPENIPIVTNLYQHLIFNLIHISLIVDRPFKVQTESNACDGTRHIIVEKEKVSQ